MTLRAEDERTVRLVRRAVLTVLAAGLLAFLVKGADSPADPHFAPEPTTTVAR